MTAKITFFPLGNADTTRIDLANGQTVLVGYANMRCADDDTDCRCDLPVLLRQALKDTNRDDYDVVCFSHLDTDHVKGATDFFWFRHASKYQGASCTSPFAARYKRVGSRNTTGSGSRIAARRSP